MENMKCLVSMVSELPECWLHRDGQIIYVAGNWRCKTLPTIGISDEDVLKELNIPYRVIKDEYGNDICEYWDPECYKEVMLTLPLYIKLPSGGYRYANKNHTGVVLDEETVNAARRLYDMIQEDICKRIEEEILYGRLKDELDGRKAVGCRGYGGIGNEKDLVLNDDHFKMIRVLIPRETWWSGKYTEATDYYVVFDVNKIELGSEVTVSVPKGKEGLFVGRNGWQVKEWSKKLGLSRVNIVGV